MAREIQYKVHVTAKDGSVASISGDAAALDVVEAALERAGARWNPEVECYDFGFYLGTPKPVRAPRRPSPKSVAVEK